MAAVKGKWVTHRRFVPSIEKALRVVEQSMLDELTAGGVMRVADVQWPPHYNPLSTEKGTTIRVEPLPAPLGATTVDAFDEGVQASLMYALVELGAVVSTTVELLIEDRDRVAVASSPRLTIVEVEDKERGEIGFFGELHFSTVTRMPLNPPRIAQDASEGLGGTCDAPEPTNAPSATNLEPEASPVLETPTQAG